MIFDELWFGYFFGALTFGWLLPCIGKRLNIGKEKENEKN